MSNIIYPRFQTVGVVPPKEVIENCDKDLIKVFIVGISPEGELYVASSHPEPEAALLLMRAQNFLVKLTGDNE